MNLEDRQFLRELCLQSLYYFDKIIIGHSKQAEIITEQLHKPILDFAQDDSLKRKGILMPRGFLKSTTVTKSKPIWDWLRNHEERILIANETFKTAKLFLEFCKMQIESNELLRYIYPELAIDKAWARNRRWSSEELDLPRQGVYSEPTISCIGVGGASQGRHFTRIYLDDLIGKNARDSEVVREDTERWFNNVKELLAMSDQDNPDASHIVLIGTNWAPGDLYETIKVRDETYEWRTVPAEDKEGNPTWPEKLGAEEIARMKSDPQDYIIFYTQYQNSPMDTDLTDFKRQWIRYYERFPSEDLKEEYVRYEHRTLNKLTAEVISVERVVNLRELQVSATIDPAFSEGGVRKSSRTAIVVVGVDPVTNCKIVLEAWAKRITEPDQLYRQVFAFHEKYRPRRWGVEAFGAQAFILKSIRGAARDARMYIPITALDKDTGSNAKEIRIRSLQDDFAPGLIYISPTHRDLMAEYLAFPMGGTKDILDALAYHKKWWTRSNTKELQAKAQAQFDEYMRKRNVVTGA